MCVCAYVCICLCVCICVCVCESVCVCEQAGGDDACGLGPDLEIPDIVSLQQSLWFMC